MDAPSGDYHYQITFDWSGNISAEFAADNDAKIYLNGVYTGIETLNGVFGFEQFTPFTITDLTPGWHSGSNTLDFVVNNWVDIPLATGLLVVPTPEPSSLVIFGSGVLAVAGLLRRKINL